MNNPMLEQLKSDMELAERAVGIFLDRINRFKKREVLRDEVNYAVLKDLRSQIVHEYVIAETDRVVTEVLKFAPLIKEMFANAKAYCNHKKFV